MPKVGSKGSPTAKLFKLAAKTPKKVKKKTAQGDRSKIVCKNKLAYRFAIHKILVSRGLFMNLLKSVPKNKSSFFNGLQAKLTGLNSVVLTTFSDLNSGSRYNDFANNTLKKLSYLKLSIRFLADFAPKLI